MRIRIIDSPPAKRGWRGGVLQIGQELDLSPHAAGILFDRGVAEQVDEPVRAAVSQARETAVLETPSGNSTESQPRKNSRRKPRAGNGSRGA